jgi:glutamate synthase domain-containing protein 2
MVEVKLSQGAKPGLGGILPKKKITPDIAEARGVDFDRDVVSPSSHTAFEGPRGLVLFLRHLRTLSGGLPVGFKLCIGRPEEFAAVVKAMLELDHFPDFITIDGRLACGCVSVSVSVGVGVGSSSNVVVMCTSSVYVSSVCGCGCSVGWG